MYRENYLTMITTVNNYKFYHLMQSSENSPVIVEYGRIGNSSISKAQYNPSEYDKKLKEKLRKGYIDQTSIYINKNVTSDNIINEEENTENEKLRNKESVELFQLLYSYAKMVVEQACISSNITQEMVDCSKKYLNELYNVQTVNEFNNILMKLMSISPRRCSDVNSMLAKNTDDFIRIIRREDNLINAMSALVKPVIYKTSVKDFATLNIEIYEANEKQKEQVMKHLDSDLQKKVHKIYRVINPDHKKRFNEYIEKNNIKKVNQYWHGSGNENWLSIIQTGLLLKPNAKITGKMFGNGIYFAPKAKKSWNYTSYNGTYWRKGSSDTAFMGLYATAYGNPLNCDSAYSYTEKEVLLKGCNCVHAHAGKSLLNDEIIFYNESAMLLNYIVEFK